MKLKGYPLNRKKQEHHEYQIYYGGFKTKLQGIWYCLECHAIIGDISKITTNSSHLRTVQNLRSHKK